MAHANTTEEYTNGMRGLMVASDQSEADETVDWLKFAGATEITVTRS